MPPNVAQKAVLNQIVNTVHSQLTAVTYPIKATCSATFNDCPELRSIALKRGSKNGRKERRCYNGGGNRSLLASPLSNQAEDLGVGQTIEAFPGEDSKQVEQLDCVLFLLKVIKVSRSGRCSKPGLSLHAHQGRPCYGEEQHGAQADEVPKDWIGPFPRPCL